MGVNCIANIVFGMACSLAPPPVETPSLMVYGRAVVPMYVVARISPALPETGPEISWRPEPPVKKRELVPENSRDSLVLAYSEPRGLKKLVPSMNRGVKMMLADGNEQVGCLKKDKKLYSAMRKIQKKYGRPLIIESAYRSKKYNDNLRARGIKAAKKSMHILCRAIDFRIEGVSTRSLAKYARSLPEVGGVGLYRNWVHIDTGRKRNW